MENQSHTGVTTCPRLLEQVRESIRRHHYSYRTEQAYMHWIKRYILFHNKRRPHEMEANEVTAFLRTLGRSAHRDHTTTSRLR